MVEFPTKKQTWESMRKSDLRARIRELEDENARLRETVQNLKEENENLHADLESIENTQWNSLTLEEREKIIKESCK